MKFMENLFRLLLLLLLILVAYFVYRMQQKPEAVTQNTPLPQENQTIILFWTLLFAHSWPFEGIRHCGTYACYFTENKDYYYKSSAVVFHSSGAHFLSDFLEVFSLERNQSQMWVYMNGESPVRSPIHYFLKRPLFNWTMTYRLDSDIKGTYALVFPGQFKSGFDHQRNYLKGKTIEVSALISHCVYDRLKAVRSLMKYIDVNLMGTCNGKWLSVTESHSQIKHSKFFLAFENSLCVDYITEKTYRNAYTNEAVPVILSGANLSNPLIVPPGSYIDASKFKTAKELADYLKYVGESKERYNKFFEWRNKWNIDTDSWNTRWCHLCEKIHKNSKLDSQQYYTDLSGLYDRKRECKPYIKWND
ncbi:PREDICTED: alpha-(1,3)-fucosyltransferase 6-like [Amphimedon queenslandica]|uniref:Fucosyltransferase n=1 Tax=Amphimedon queenslandica TaxID=400682 RepID=A0A1X7V4Q4_AMPQE|nr:PREDICTED: alpha-(1,3)-fucosyltransferase 6-like [Amphimedon queenslandica]|eukprot:XP_003385580.1 PREDICTED: alpha-(1,3)-fucosyltransferase 6-like [Amphimedon queenslandica]